MQFKGQTCLTASPTIWGCTHRPCQTVLSVDIHQRKISVKLTPIRIVLLGLRIAQSRFLVANMTIDHCFNFIKLRNLKTHKYWTANCEQRPNHSTMHHKSCIYLINLFEKFNSTSFYDRNVYNYLYLPT